MYSVLIIIRSFVHSILSFGWIMNSKEAGKQLMHNMVIYANQAMTSHQYSIWTKDIVWEQRYGSCVNSVNFLAHRLK